MTGSISFYTKYLNMAMPEFNINTWHDFMYDAFKVLDASIGNLYSVENFKGAWKNSTIYYVGDKLINSEDFLIYEVLIEHTTDGTSTVSDFITNNPTYYKVYDPITLSRAWAINETLVNNEDYSSRMYAVGTIEQNPNGSSKYYMEETNSLKVDVQGLKDNVDSTKLLIDDVYTNVTSLKDETLGYRNESETFATNSENSSVNSENSSINSNTYANNSLNYMNQTLIYRNEAEVFRDEAEQATIGKANTSLDNLDTDGKKMLFPVGGIVMSPVSSIDGFVLCNGGTISRTIYSKLFTIIGTTFGVGDGSTTFNLPDYRGKFLRGLGGNSASNFATTQAEGVPNITGSFTATSNSLCSGAFSLGGVVQGQPYYQSSQLRTYNFSAKSSNSLYGASSHITPINQAVNYFIKY